MPSQQAGRPLPGPRSPPSPARQPGAPRPGPAHPSPEARVPFPIAPRSISPPPRSPSTDGGAYPPPPPPPTPAAPHHELERLLLQDGLGRVHRPARPGRAGAAPPLSEGRSERRREPALPRAPPTSPRCPHGACAAPQAHGKWSPRPHPWQGPYLPVKTTSPGRRRSRGHAGSRLAHASCLCRGPTGVVVAWGRDGARCGQGWDGHGLCGQAREGDEEAHPAGAVWAVSGSRPSLGWKVRLAPESTAPRSQMPPPGGLGCSRALLRLRSVLLHCGVRADSCCKT